MVLVMFGVGLADLAMDRAVAVGNSLRNNYLVQIF